MSSCVALHTQLASIMEVLANAAVAEICKLIDDSYAVLRSEMSRSQKENEVLKRKLSMQMTELRIAKEGRFPSTEGTFHNQFDTNQWKAPAESTTVDEDDTSVQLAKRDESADMIELIPQSILIKKESVEEDLENSSLQRGLRERAMESDGGEKAFIVDTQTVLTAGTENVAEKHRTKHSVWDDGGLDAVLKSEPEIDAVNLQDTGSEHTDGKQNGLSYEYGTYDRSSQQQTFFMREKATPHALACSYVAATDSESLPVHTELQLCHTDERAAGEGQASVGCLDMKLGAEAIDSIPNELEDESVQGVVQAKSRQYEEHRAREELLPENISNTYSAQSRMTVKENITISKPITSDMIGYSLFDESFTMTKRDKMYHRAGTREKRFICTFCGKSFTCPKNLETHQRVHTGEKPFSCTQCGKRFADSSNRKRHQIIHTGERPYSCTLCGKRFTQSSCLIAHQRVHTGEKPFGCTQCGKRFADSSNLKRHQSVHIGKKPLSCTLWEEFTCFKAS